MSSKQLHSTQTCCYWQLQKQTNKIKCKNKIQKRIPTKTREPTNKTKVQKYTGTHKQNIWYLYSMSKMQNNQPEITKDKVQ